MPWTHLLLVVPMLPWLLVIILIIIPSGVGLDVRGLPFPRVWVQPWAGTSLTLLYSRSSPEDAPTPPDPAQSHTDQLTQDGTLKTPCYAQGSGGPLNYIYQLGLRQPVSLSQHFSTAPFVICQVGSWKGVDVVNLPNFSCWYSVSFKGIYSYNEDLKNFHNLSKTGCHQGGWRVVGGSLSTGHVSLIWHLLRVDACMFFKDTKTNHWPCPNKYVSWMGSFIVTNKCFVTTSWLFVKVLVRHKVHPLGNVSQSRNLGMASCWTGLHDRVSEVA